MKKQYSVLENKNLNSSPSYIGVMIAREHNFKLTPELIYLIEALKVEGYWSLKNNTASIQNKNINFLKYIESILKDLEMNVYRRILFKIKPTMDFSKEDSTLSCNGKILNFHIEKSPFDGSKKIVTSLPYRKEYNLTLKVKKKIYRVLVKVSEEEITVKSKLKGWAYYGIRFPNKRLLTFLSDFVGDNKKVKIDPFLFKADKEYVAAAFSALIDAEGSVTHYRLFRRIRIRMRSHNYLKDWKRLLNKFEINCWLNSNDIETELVIEGWEDLDKLKRLGLRLRHSNKVRKLQEIFDSYKRNQISRGTAYSFYTKKLKEIGKPITAREFAEKLGKSKRVVNHYLVRLMKKDLIKVDKSKMTYLYSINNSLPK